MQRTVQGNSRDAAQWIYQGVALAIAAAAATGLAGWLRAAPASPRGPYTAWNDYGGYRDAYLALHQKVRLTV